MATQVGQGQQFESQGQAQQQPGAKGDIAPVLQQLNMTSLRTRTQDLHAAIGRILHAFHTNPSTKWSEVLGQFAMVNVELLNLVDDIKPILKMYVVYPKNVNAENAPILPIMLSSKLLPEMEAEEAAMKEQILGGLANLPVPLQTDKLQRQIEAVRSACDVAEKVITEARKVYGLGTRQGPVALATLDKMHVTRIAEQERLLRAATNFGEGLRLPADQHQQPAMLPQHLSAAFATSRDGRASSYLGADGGYVKASVPVLPPSGLRSSGQQQATQLGSRVQTPAQSIGTGGVGGLTGSSSPQLPYMVNSPRSGGNNFNVSSPQQSQTQQQSQAAFLQRTKAQQQQQQLQRQQQQMQAQLQQQQQQQHHHHQQQQQLRHPTTPPIPQVGGQLQAQVAQPLLQQQKQQLQQQSQNRLTQQLAQHQQAQLQQQVLQLQERHAMQVSQHQQNLQQQLQSSQLQAAQNTVQQASQVRPQIGQQGSSMSNLYGSGTHTLLTSNVMGAMSQPTQSQTLLQQRIQQFQQGNISTNQLSANQPQQNVSSMLSDSWGTGTGAQLPQNSTNLGLPLQQQQLPQTNYMNMFNSPAQTNFGQNRQQPPPS